MAFTMAGTVYFPRDEFWEWVEGRFPDDCLDDDPFDDDRAKIDVVNMGLLLTSMSGRVLDIDLIEFFQEVRAYLPTDSNGGFEGAEHQFGIPRLTKFDFEIDICMSSEGVEGITDERFGAILQQWDDAKSAGPLVLIGLQDAQAAS
ncbi:hypothetical protein A3709_18815 [Halioglobus sp. HI00S01]|uniref:hypothetical protein n=1 Tax=Halioglobus sp. HI00S01 TaxID=1822214 RepID=UPI0007C33C6C|nr:hypothetical protein [Halioglobus sp. HI00S01]KZX57677.1 hypothetical protein A3709_18815 [Halioglobus sp. HI00S01]